MKRYYYERDDGVIVDYSEEIDVAMPFGRLTRRVYIVPTDPADVVAELRVCQKRAALIAADSDNDPFRLGRESAWGNAADLVAKKLGVES